MKRAFQMIVVCCIALASDPASGEQGRVQYPIVVGNATVWDGDTIKMAHATVTAEGKILRATKVKIRLLAIDTPEKTQTCTDRVGGSYPCGLVATEALATMVGTGPVTCELHDVDQYRRWVGVCSTELVADLNAEMVRRGLAVAAKEYGRDYLADERVAKKQERGLWAGKFALPKEWRDAQKAKRKK